MALLQISEPGMSTAPHQHRLAVGIDLGTTFSTIAYVDARGQVRTVTNREGEPLTPSAVPRARRETDPPDTWEHLTWKSLQFKVDHPHAFAFEFRSDVDSTRTARFTVSAYGDLDGDGVLSTFEVRGERTPGQPARAVPGMFVDREVE